MIERTRKIKVTVYSDGRPGHEKQSRALVTALSRYFTVETNWVMVTKPSVSFHIVKLICYFLGWGSRQKQTNPGGLIIGTGSATHLPILHQKKSSGARAVICMSPPSYLLSRFDLCCIPSHDNVTEKENVFLTTGPPSLCVDQGVHSLFKGLILVGGPNAETDGWYENSIAEAIKQILEVHKSIEWKISSSPRTPTKTEKMLNQFCDQHEHATFYTYQETMQGWVEAEYAACKTVWVTADSVSMVFEALSAGCRVGIIPVQWKCNTNKFVKSIQILEEQGRVFSLTKGLDQKVNDTPEPELLNEADRCAREIIRRWWSKT